MIDNQDQKNPTSIQRAGRWLSSEGHGVSHYGDLHVRRLAAQFDEVRAEEAEKLRAELTARERERVAGEDWSLSLIETYGVALESRDEHGAKAVIDAVETVRGVIGRRRGGATPRDSR